ncbi:MAG: NFYB/HAP3 family transcription factor subunit [Candidatus Micrarchaeota archaeon]|nr:NFYB/HAP3 family transcription factor subunit [Candidatus Micrarchaeota archaeon]
MRISKMTIKKILKEQGAERVSESAATELARIVNRYAYSIAKRAVKLAAHAKRKTVEKADIDLAK